MSSTEIVISVENLGKRYLIGHQSHQDRSQTLRESVTNRAKGGIRKAGSLFRGRQILVGSEVEEFWALKNVSFQVKRGEVLGLIGRNGAGKSTLLKVLSRITEPSEGRIEIRGRVASLLEVGTGFHPELTGRENIFLNGAILGMTKNEIRSKFDEIVDFAEVESFLDTPVKRYSSGMYVRLAFAVAAHLDPEILVIDEVLAVGDAAFQKKCLGKMRDVASGGRTVLFVSHNMPMVKRLCSRAIVLENGNPTFNGEVEQGIQFYINQSKALSEERPLSAREDRSGNGKLRFTEVRISSPGCPVGVVRMGQPAEISLHYQTQENIPVCDISIHLHNMWDQTVLRFSTLESSDPFNDLQSRGVIRCQFDQVQLLPGQYTILAAASVPPSYEYLDYVTDAVTFEVQPSDIFGTGRIPEFGLFYTECKWLQPQIELGH